MPDVPDDTVDFERAYRSGRMRIDPRIFLGAVPAVVFLIARQFLSTQLSIGVSFAASAFVFFRNPGHGVIRALSVLSFVVVTIAAVIGIISENETAFVAQNLAGDFIIAGVCVGSMIARRPLIGGIARELAPGIRPVMPIEHPTFMWLTAANAAVQALVGLARAVMLVTLSTGVYVIVSRVVFIPLNIGFVLFCYREVTRSAIRIWPADMPPPPEWQMRDEPA